MIQGTIRTVSEDYVVEIRFRTDESDDWIWLVDPVDVLWRALHAYFVFC